MKNATEIDAGTPGLPAALSSVVGEPASGPDWLTLENTKLALQKDAKTRADLQAMLDASGDSRTPEQWLLDDLREGDTNTYFQDIVRNASLPVVAQNALDDFKTDETPVSFFDPKEPPALPPAIQNVIDTFLGAGGGTDTPSTGTNLPTPTDPTGGPDVVVSPTVTTTNVFSVVVDYITNIFNPPPAPPTTSNPQGNAGTTPDPVNNLNSFLSPTNGAPLVNDAAQGSATSPGGYSAGQTPDPNQMKPSGLPATVAGVIRGLEIPGLSQIKNDRLLILATLSAPLLALLALWLVKKTFFRAS